MAVTCGAVSADSVLQYEGWVSQFLIYLLPRCHCEIQQPAQSWQGDWHTHTFTHILTFTFSLWMHTHWKSQCCQVFFAAAVGWIWLCQPTLSKSPWVWAPIISSAASLSHNPLHLRPVGQSGICEWTRALRTEVFKMNSRYQALL